MEINFLLLFLADKKCFRTNWNPIDYEFNRNVICGWLSKYICAVRSSEKHSWENGK